MNIPEGLDPGLWHECEDLAADVNAGMGTPTESDVRDLYSFAMAQRRVADQANLNRAARFYDRGKRDGAKTRRSDEAI